MVTVFVYFNHMNIKLIIVIVTVAVLIVVGIALWQQGKTPVMSNTPTTNQTAAPTTLTTEDSLVGTGPEATTGQTIRVHYTGRLLNGTVFDSSINRGQPFSFTLGSGQVIRGWDQGIVGMKVGGKRRLTIPPSLAYGDEGFPPVIPPKATLVFDVELIGIGEQ